MPTAPALLPVVGTQASSRSFSGKGAAQHHASRVASTEALQPLHQYFVSRWSQPISYQRRVGARASIDDHASTIGVLREPQWSQVRNGIRHIDLARRTECTLGVPGKRA